MPRDLPIGNGSLLVAFDAQYRLADFYFPHVGMENHATAEFRTGIWCDGRLHPLDEPPWTRTLEYLRETLVTDVTLTNEELGIRLRAYDAVDPERNILVRKLVVKNQRAAARDIRIFMHFAFGMYGNTLGDTVFFDPRSGGIVQYKSHRFVLLNLCLDEAAGIPEYQLARSPVSGGEGSWADAADGELSRTPIAHGSVDGTYGAPLHLEPHGNATLFSWICAGRDEAEVRALDERVRQETPARILSRTGSWWYTWVHKPGIDLTELPDETVDLYRRSLLVMATQCDRDGGVLAANDSDIQWGHNDHYSYVWMRDAAFVCDALDRAGFPEITHRFLLFANRTIRDEGYFLNKYNPDGSAAPIWQPWVRGDVPQLPIQEDETALVLWLLHRHYERTRDLELLRNVFDRLVAGAGDFLAAYRDPETGLPQPCFDLWEERQGVFTFTCAAVCAGLQAAAELANVLNAQERRAVYLRAAAEIRDAMRKHLWIEAEGRFARGLILRDEHLELDPTVDASAFATFYFDLFPASSAAVQTTMDAVRERLAVHTDFGGIARYEGDAYHRISEEMSRVPGNPWILCTLWLAEHEIAKATTIQSLEHALDSVRWARARATPSMILPEQIDPYDGQPLSVAPLTWSHAQIVSIVHGVLEARARLR